MTGRKRWIVTLSGQRPLGEVRTALESAGFEIENVLDIVGVITGTWAGASVSPLAEIEGVADVSPDSDVDIGPPDAPSTW
jgi:hypothetical protein